MLEEVLFGINDARLTLRLGRMGRRGERTSIKAQG